MSYHFNWHNLPPDMRLGAGPDSMITLFRGFAPNQLDAKRGMLSAALRHGKLGLIDDVVSAVEARNIGRAISFVSSHAVSSNPQETGIFTPFVSTALDKDIAESYAQRGGGMLATLALRADQVMAVPLLRYEALAVGSIGMDSIVDVEMVELRTITNPYGYKPSTLGIESDPITAAFMKTYAHEPLGSKATHISPES